MPATPAAGGHQRQGALDIEWSDPAQKASAIGTLVEQLDRLERWIAREFGDEAGEPPLAEPLATLRQLRDAGSRPEPPDGKPRIRKGTAEDRRVSVEDKDMRHGRKSKSKRFNGYKGHIAVTSTPTLIVACGDHSRQPPRGGGRPRPAGRHRPRLRPRDIAQLSIDRGYIKSPSPRRSSPAAAKCSASRGSRATGRSSARATSRSTCARARSLAPPVRPEPFTPGQVVEFDPELCPVPPALQMHLGRRRSGRTVPIADDEPLQHRLRKLVASPTGRGAYASASRSSMPSPMSHASKAAALATSASERTSSTSAATLPSSISRPSTAVT